MKNLPCKKIILFILVVTILVAASGCQSKLGKDVERSIHEFSHAPDRLGNIFTKIMGGLSDIGAALADSVSRMIGNMTGR
jgi:hypothetical protein